MPRKRKFPPTIHVRAGRARIVVDGRDYPLGPADSPQAQAEYARLVALMAANGGRMPPPRDQVLTVAEALAEWDRYAQRRYADSPERLQFPVALGPVLDLFGARPVAEFGLAELHQVREAYLAHGWCRRVCNRMVIRVRTAWRRLELVKAVPPGSWAALRALPPLAEGEAPDPPRVHPVSDEVIEQTLPHLNPIVRAAVEVQRWTGARPSEVLGLRAGDVLRGGVLEPVPGLRIPLGPVWAVQLARHKTARHGRQRILLFSRRAQQALAPLIDRPAGAYLFRPLEATLSYLNGFGYTPKLSKGRRPGERYTAASYGHAVAAGCDRAFPPPPELRPMGRESWRAWRRRMTSGQLHLLDAWRRDHRWFPYQLRHAAATRLRAQFGLEVARVILGHSTQDMTEHYAVEDWQAAIDALGRAG